MSTPQPDTIDLQALAKQAMRDNAFEPDFPPAAAAQLAQLHAHPPQVAPESGIRDLRALAWSSIDNDSSRDLDQVEVAEALANGDTRILIGIADVDAFVPKGSPLDDYAAVATATVYTGVRNFPMLPEAISNDASSLLEGADKLAVVVELVITDDGSVRSSDVYRAVLRNKFQLTYNAVGPWLDDPKSAAPHKIAASKELQAQLLMQDRAAQALKNARFRHGALNIETIELRPIVLNDRVVDVEKQEKNPATELVEEFMIATNGVVARTLEARGVSSIRRVVKTPKRWDRIVALAKECGATLPATPDSKALNDFLLARKAADADHFADLSLAVIKLMGPGEYVLERPGDAEQGHFGLAVQDYAHSTAPNRRFADLVTQRLVKAVLAGAPPPYTDDQLTTIAKNCTQRADAARKVERVMTKRIAAVAMSRRIGEIFDAMVTGVTPHGTFVRVLQPAVEGLLTRGEHGVDVGDRVRVKLLDTDPARGYIDFARV
jgi:VacB/RNase II family 3'-5' exoribonuclease